ncbi:MAG TPA: Sec-independent protein translocase protein TatB, partial [Nevskia sp.]|nr:Sec-independent protein translocase protein TatB [Nevskia sp.]
ELLVCFLVALVVLGPEKLPRVARGIGRWTGQAKAYMRNLSAELDREAHTSELKKQIGDAKRLLTEESESFKRGFEAVAEQGNSMLRDHPDPIPPPAVATPAVPPVIAEAPTTVAVARPADGAAERAVVEPRKPEKHV